MRVVLCVGGSQAWHRSRELSVSRYNEFSHTRCWLTRRLPTHTCSFFGKPTRTWTPRRGCACFSGIVVSHLMRHQVGWVYVPPSVESVRLQSSCSAQQPEPFERSVFSVRKDSQTITKISDQADDLYLDPVYRFLFRSGTISNIALLLLYDSHRHRVPQASF
jgi:hypothetical protein